MKQFNAQDPDWFNCPIGAASDSVIKTSAVGVPAVAAGKEDGDLGEFRTKLLFFLDSSTSYEPARLISDFPFDGKSSISCACVLSCGGRF